MRKWFSIISSVFIFLVILAMAGVWQFNRVLNGLQIDAFNYQLESFNLRHITFSELSFVHNSNTGQQIIQLHNITADWQWQSWLSPRLGVISIDDVQLPQMLADIKITTADKVEPLFSLPESWSISDTFPEQLQIKNLNVKLPCAVGLCPFAGDLNALKIKIGQTTTGVDLKLNLSPGETKNAEHQITLSARYAVEQNLPSLNINLGVDDGVNVQLNTYLTHQNETVWIGNVKGYAAYPNEWWLTYLRKWNIQIASQTYDQKITSARISLDSDWTLALTPLVNLPKNATRSEWVKALSGHWLLATKIPTPVIISNLGEFSGNANIDLDMSAGQLNHYALAIDVIAKHFFVSNELTSRGLEADALHLQIKSKLDSAVSLSALPVDVVTDTQGVFQSNLTGRLWIDALAKKITVEQLVVSVKAKQLKPVVGLQLDDVSMDVHLSGAWQPEKFEFNVTAPSRFSADVLAPSLSIAAKSAQFSTAQFNVSGDISQGEVVWLQIKFITDALFSGGVFHHPQINTKAWSWRGKAQGSPADFNATGDLGVGSSLVVKHQLKYKASKIVLDWTVKDIFLLAANPFAEILSVWPQLLSLSLGNINANGNLVFDVEKNKLIKSNTELQLSDVSGIYDTFIFQGLSSQINFVSTEKNLAMSTKKLSVNHINKGFDFGPLVAEGNYKSNWSTLMRGTLTLQSFNCAAMGGSFTTAAQQFDLSRVTQNVIVELKDINVAHLLKQYSSSEISGTGQLSGVVPIEITRTGIRVAQGVMAAAAPGGQLKMKSERANAMAKNQPSMKLIVDALNDFHYTALASKINYDESGKLLLAINLEGRNPALENGRPINLNINLEEDVPAMLASIQLGSKVTDIVKKRLQERVQKKEIP